MAEQTAVRPALPELVIVLWGPEQAKLFLDTYHPLGAGGSLRGQKYIFGGYEGDWPVFCAVFASPRSRWKNTNVVLELTRLAWSPLAVRSAATFLKKCLRMLRSSGMRGDVVTYALPGTTGKVYLACGFKPFGHSSGTPWSRRGPGERPTPNTIGTGKKLLRFRYTL